MKKKSVKIFGIILLVFLMMNFLETEEEIPFVWKGTIIVRQKKLPGEASAASGEIITVWTLYVNWKETQKNDIKDKDRNLVGQLVKLEDNGSSWSGETSGRFVDASGEQIHSGSGQGMGPVMSAGWLYYSLSEEDPLSSVLPNGSYAFGSSSGQTQKFGETIEFIDYDPPSSYTMNSSASLGYYVSVYYVFLMPFSHIGGGPTVDGPTSAEGIKMTIENSERFVPQSLPIQWDREKNILQDKRMSGRFSGSWGNNSLVNEVEWDIGKVYDLQGTIEKPDQTWRPKGGDEKNKIDISAKIQDPKGMEGKWKFTLFDVSSERGYAMNKGDENSLDLQFAEGQQDFSDPEKTNDGWIIESTKTTSEMDVKVESLDYGAWGKIKAEVNVEGTWYECTSIDGDNYVTIPYDDDEDHIADMWEEHFGVEDDSENADDDAQPESKQDGDGFTNYEEYRGFYVNGVWTEWEFSPEKKDLFIYDEIGMGVANFTETQLKIHLIDKKEYDSHRVVNFNRGHGTLTSQSGQKGLYLHQEELTGLWGEVRPTVGTPNVVEEVVMDSIGGAAISAYIEKGPEGGFLRNYSVSIAHELGHAVNIMHHGDGVWEADRNYEIARRGGLWSGDTACIMRYEAPNLYLGIDGQIYPYPEDEEGAESGTSFCISPTGTGINAPGERTGLNGQPYPVAADAESGNCKDSITLKGYKTEGR